jgi:hypothetical protein
MIVLDVRMLELVFSSEFHKDFGFWFLVLLIAVVVDDLELGKGAPFAFLKCICVRTLYRIVYII